MLILSVLLICILQKARRSLKESSEVVSEYELIEATYLNYLSLTLLFIDLAFFYGKIYQNKDCVVSIFLFKNKEIQMSWEVRERFASTFLTYRQILHFFSLTRIS